MSRIWTGSAVVTSGYTEVLLVGDALSDANCPADAQIVLGGSAYFVDSRVDTQNVVLTRPYEGTDGSVSAEIDPMTPTTISIANLAKIIAEYDARASLLEKGVFYTTLGFTGANDPGPGKLARNGATWGESTALYFDVLDGGGIDATPLIDVADIGTVVTIRSVDTRGYVSFRLTAAPTVQSGWRSISGLDYLGGGGTVADDEDVIVEFLRIGEGLAYDVHVPNIAGLSAYFSEPDGYRVLVSDTGSGSPGLYTLDQSTSPQEWIGPASIGGVPGQGLDYDAHISTMATLYTYEDQETGYRVLVDDVGDGRSGIFSLIDGGSPTQWQGPAYVTGAQGPAGTADSVLTTRGDLLRRGATIAERFGPGATGQVPRYDGTDTAFGTMLAGGFATGPGIITPAMLDNGSAISILGRSANSGGARADIAAGSDDTILRRVSSALGFGQITAGMIPSGLITYAMIASAALNSSGSLRAATASKILTAAQVWSDADFATLTDAATIAVDMSALLTLASVVLGGSRTLGAPSNTKNGQFFCLKVTATGSTRTLTLHANYKVATGIESFPISVTTSETVYVCGFVESSTVIRITSVLRY